jgi:hypothetical protein
MAAIQPSLLIKHFKPDLGEAERTTPCSYYVRSGTLLNDPRVQRAADDVLNYLCRHMAIRGDGATASRSRS